MQQFRSSLLSYFVFGLIWFALGIFFLLCSPGAYIWFGLAFCGTGLLISCLWLAGNEVSIQNETVVLKKWYVEVARFQIYDVSKVEFGARQSYWRSVFSGPLSLCFYLRDGRKYYFNFKPLTKSKINELIRVLRIDL